MSEIAVIGPFATRRLGVVRQCIEFRAAAGPGAPECPGCIAPPSKHTQELIPVKR